MELKKEIEAVLKMPHAFMLPQKVRDLILNLAVVVDTLERRVLALESESKSNV